MLFIFEDSILITTPQWITSEQALLFICLYINVCTHYVACKNLEGDRDREEKGGKGRKRDRSMKISPFAPASFIFYRRRHSAHIAHA